MYNVDDKLDFLSPMETNVLLMNWKILISQLRHLMPISQWFVTIFGGVDDAI